VKQHADRLGSAVLHGDCARRETLVKTERFVYASGVEEPGMALRKFGLDGMVVAVTGAGQEIGRSIASDAAASARPWRMRRTERDLAPGAECRPRRVCHTTAIDLATTAGAGRVSSTTRSRPAVVRPLVNNAGTNLSGALDYTERKSTRS